MSEEAQTLLKDILFKAHSLSLEDRASFLQQACAGQPDLLARVQSLLSTLDNAGDVLCDPTIAHPSMLLPLADESLGTRIGSYTLTGVLGTGGFGIVYEAEQTQPISRTVALKVLKLGMDTRQVLARFENERQALEVMEHAGIARVLDAGMTETGRPYFVMELVRGASIIKYCDEHRVSVRGRLELFASVCRAVQHAHSKGIIHRDLKPSNILVAEEDGRPVPKVIDFGIATALRGSTSLRTSLTEGHQLVGTLEYMSPEQASGGGDVDTRADVYALGVVLYELLTSVTPLDPAALRSGSFPSVLHAICEVDAPRPSTRAATRSDLPAIAANRDTESGRLISKLRGDLDWISLKCLEKDRARRYDTVSALEADIRRHLAGLTVLAAPASRTYVLHKFIRRHRAAAAASLVIAISMTVATVISLRFGFQEAAAVRRSDRIFDFMTSALQAGDALAGGSPDASVAGAMGKASRDLDGGAFRDDPETDASLRNVIGLILAHNGHPQEAEKQFERSLNLHRAIFGNFHPEVATSLNNLGMMRSFLGNPKGAEPLFQEALSIRKRLAKGEDGDVSLAMTNLAGALKDINRLPEAEQLCRDALAMRRRLYKGDSEAVAASLNNLAHVLEMLGRVSDADAMYAEAVAMERRVHPADDEDIAQCMRNLGNLRRGRGCREDAEPLLVEALAMRRRLFHAHDHPSLAMNLHDLGCFRFLNGEVAESEALLAESAAMGWRIFPAGHQHVAASIDDLGYVTQARGRLHEGEQLLRLALEMRVYLAPDGDEYVANSLVHLADAEQLLGKASEAEQHYLKAIELGRRIAPSASGALAKALYEQAKAHFAAGDGKTAGFEISEAMTLAEKLIPSDDKLRKDCWELWYQCPSTTER